MATQAAYRPGGALPPIRGLEDYWAGQTFRAPAVPPFHSRLLLSLLGLGLEQTIRHLGSTQPDWETFRDWIVATAGVPDADRVARYHAAIDAAPPPPATQALFDAVTAMPPALDTDDLARWDAEGVVILRQAIAPDEAAAAAGLLWDTLGASPDDRESWYGHALQGIMLQRFQHPAMEPARRAVRIHKAFAQLWGDPDLWPTIDRMSFNAPERPGHGFPGPHLHWDVSLARPIPFGTQGILYLTDTAADQGALQVVPGFHRRLEGWLHKLGDADPRQVDLSAEAVTVAAGAGDLVIWRHELPHGASPNTARRPRLAQYINMHPPRWIEASAWR